MLIIFFLFAGIHVSSTLYGPRLLISHVGGSVTIKCYYVTTSVNRHDRKFLCKESPYKSCQTIISSNAFIDQNYKERVSMYNNPQQGILQVTIRELKKTDSSYYRCGIGKIYSGLYVRVNLMILEGRYLPKSPQIVWGKLTGSVELQCPFETPKLEMKKFLCKMTRAGCSPIDGKSKNRQHNRQIIMTNGNSSRTFSVTINDLKRQDSGVYVCGTRKLDKNASVKTIQLQVVEESVFSNILNDTQTIYESETTPSYWNVTSTDEIYKKRSSYGEQNLLAIAIPVPVLLLLFAVTVMLILVKIRQRKTASLNIHSKSPEGEMPSTSQRCLEEHTQNDNRNSANEDECALNSDEDILLPKLGNTISASARKQPSSECTKDPQANAIVTIYCMANPEDSNKND